MSPDRLTGLTAAEVARRVSAGQVNALPSRSGRTTAQIVRDNVFTRVNAILATNDPTAHAELTALRAASRQLGSPDLSGCVVYASGHPCPMCMAAMRLAGVRGVAYAYSNDDGAPFGLSTAAVYADLAKPFAEQSMHIRHLPVAEEASPELYAAWAQAQKPQA